MATVQATVASGGTSASHPYTCNTCQVAYRNIDLQKAHMKSDWHRYNLKRRVASLPPISAEIFTEKVLQARAATTAEADKAYFERACEACQKTYYSENAYQNHLSSQKHKHKEDALAGAPQVVGCPDDETTSVVSSTFSLGEPVAVGQSEAESVDSDAEHEFNQVIEGLQRAQVSEQRPSPVKRPSHPQPAASTTADEALAEENGESRSTTPVPSVKEPVWTLESCIFCNYSSPTVPLNAHHMERFHGMFIPEKKYLVDLEGLLQSLQDKVREAHQCLYCDKTKTTIFGLQTHMRDTGHCKIPFTTEEEQLEIGDYYDFRSTYSDGEDDEDDEDVADEAHGGAKLGARRSARVEGADGEQLEEEGDGWETDSSASSLDSADLTSVPADGRIEQFERLDKHSHHSHHDAKQRHQADGWHSHAHKHTRAVFHDDYELHLPSGKSVGHRSLNKYFRQNLHNYPTPEERAERLAIEESGGADEADVVRGRDMIPRGQAGMTGVTTQQKRDVRKSEQRGRDQELFHTRRNDLSYGKKLNNQKTYYYRYQSGG